MDILIKGRNIPVTEALERYAREKVERVTRFFDEERSVSRAEVELLHERNRAVSEPEVAEATLFINGSVLKASDASEDMYASIDRMSDKLERQVKRLRGRQIDRWQGQMKNTTAAEGGPDLPSILDDERLRRLGDHIRLILQLALPAVDLAPPVALDLPLQLVRHPVDGGVHIP